MFYFLRLAHNLLRYIIVLICSLLDAVEGIESPPAAQELATRFSSSAHKHSLAGQGAGAPVCARRQSNYFHRRYLSRRSLSALLLLDQEEEQQHQLEEDEPIVVQ